jgi:hypothetical protein
MTSHDAAARTSELSGVSSESGQVETYTSELAAISPPHFPRRRLM